MNEIYSTEFDAAIAEGRIPGYSFIEKFGENDDIDAANEEVVWDGGGDYTYQSSAQSVELVSDSASDTSAGSGAQEVIIEGLDGSYNLQSETVSTTGTTPVNLSNTYLRIFRAYVGDVGANEKNVGNITIRVQGGGDTMALILADRGQTNMAIYTIPNGFTGYLKKVYLTILRGNGTQAVAVDANLCRRSPGQSWRSTHPIGLLNTGTGARSYEFPYGIVCPAQMDIELRADSSANDTRVTGGFTIRLRKNDA